MTARADRPRMLLVAEAANPEWASVPLVGWSLASAIAERTDAHLVTQVRNRDAILRAGMVEGRDFSAIDTEKLEKPMWKVAEKLSLGSKGGWTTLAAMTAITYPYFERLVWAAFGDRIKAGEFDVVHRITPVSPTAIGPLAAKVRKAGVPFMLGPINGGVPWPKGFESTRRREREWLSGLRGIHKMRPGHRRMLASSDVILCGSKFALDEIPADLRHNALLFPENGIDPTRFRAVAHQPGTLPVRACFIGRLVPLKGVGMAIEAAAPLLASGQMRFDVIGDGSERATLERQVAEAGLADAVTFHGWLDHRQVQDVASRSHMLLFPSIREFGGGAVLEAMALGLVPLVVDYAGPGELVDAEVGFKVPIGPRESIIAGLRDVLEGVVSDPSVLRPMGDAARARVQRDFLWSAKAARLIKIASAVASNR